MKNLLVLVSLLAACVSAQPGDVVDAGTDAVSCTNLTPQLGAYTLTLENTGTVSEFCPSWGEGHIYLTSAAEFQATCTMANASTCSTDFFDSTNTCGTVHITATGFTLLTCTYTFSDEYTLTGTCIDSAAPYFACPYETSLVYDPSTNPNPAPLDMGQ